jgi:holo-[acyl-carrier protein] synthase
VSIAGLGIDSVEVGRFRRVAARRGKAFLRRLFTAGELKYCLGHADPIPRLAARFAAKEALLKSLDAKGDWTWRDMEVRRAESGKPTLVLARRAAAFARRRRIRSFHVSLTHDAGRATAIVLAESR